MTENRLLIATANPGKLREICSLIPAGIDSVGLDELGFVMPSEVGSSFQEIAHRKAIFAARESGLLALADDSGLEVEALGGAPGTRSARFAGEPPDDARNRRLLLSQLDGKPSAERTARFVCAITIATPTGITWTSEGQLEGTIFERERGAGGFGYDSLFLLPDGRTLAELLDEEKNAMSHRAQAMAKILPELLSALAAGCKNFRATR